CARAEVMTRSDRITATRPCPGRERKRLIEMRVVAGSGFNAMAWPPGHAEPRWISLRRQEAVVIRELGSASVPSQWRHDPAIPVGQRPLQLSITATSLDSSPPRRWLARTWDRDVATLLHPPCRVHSLSRCRF